MTVDADSSPTDSGIQVKAVYRASDLKKVEDDWEAEPGQPPYTRGIYPEMYRRSLWTVRPLAGYGTATDTNERIRRLLTEGATGVNVVFDYPTNRGYDSDEAIAEGDAGQGGVAIDSVEDMTKLLEAIPIDQISVSIVLSHPVAAGAIMAMFLVAAERLGFKPADLRGTLQNDFMMETVVLTAPDILRPAASFRLSMDIVEYCAKYLPQWNPISFCGYNYREVGVDAVEEVAFVVANAIATLAELARRGLDADLVARRLSSFFSADREFFEEVAKYRAARRVYHYQLTSRFAFTDPKSSRLRFHVQTAGSALTSQQPLNNVARAAYHALAAVLGGAQSLHVSAYDEALCVPSETAAMTALRTQQIVAEETGVTKTADPLGGSYFVESLTSELEAQIERLISEIEKAGGLVAAVESGWVQERFLDSAYRRDLAVESGERRIVGVNVYSSLSPPIEVFRVPETLSRQRATLSDLRHARDNSHVQASLASLDSSVRSTENTFPHLLNAVSHGATLGECCRVFRGAHGGWHQRLV